jgi:hypothetical protein
MNNLLENDQNKRLKYSKILEIIQNLNLPLKKPTLNQIVNQMLSIFLRVPLYLQDTKLKFNILDSDHYIDITRSILYTKISSLHYDYNLNLLF